MKNMIRTQSKAGFTLIELLVVIAIIGLLSSVILVSVNKARIKAQDSKKMQTVKQYINALELYKTTTGSYPNFGVADSEGIIWDLRCLGNGNTSGTCIGGYGTEDASLYTALQPYIKAPADTYPMKNSGVSSANWNGIAYACMRSNSSQPCTHYYIEWLVASSPTAKCSPGWAWSSSGFGNYNDCFYTTDTTNSLVADCVLGYC